MSNIFSEDGGFNFGKNTVKPFTLSEPTPAEKKPEDGFFDNLVDDVVDTVKGVPQGIVNMVTDPIGTVKDTAKGVWHNWSPLFRGDTDEWWDNFTEHPLGPMLDIFAVVSAGVGAPGSVASMAARAGSKTALNSKAFKLANPEARTLYPAGTKEQLMPRGKLKKDLQKQAQRELTENRVTRTNPEAMFTPSPDIVRQYRSNPLARTRQKGTDFLLESLGTLPAFTYVSKEAKYQRLVNKTISRRRVSGKIVAEAGKEAIDLSSGKDHLSRVQRGIAGSLIVRQFYAAGKIATEHPQVISEIVDRQIADQMFKIPVRLGKLDEMQARINGDKENFNRPLDEPDSRQLEAMFDPNFLPLRKDFYTPGERSTFEGEVMQLPTYTISYKSDGTPYRVETGKENKTVGGVGVTRNKQDPLFTLDPNNPNSAPDPNIEANYGKYASLNTTELALEHISSAGSRMTMTMEEFRANPERALTDKDGYVLGAANQRLQSLIGEAHGSVEALAKLYTIPTSVWKFIVLGMRPAYLVNNVVGNMLMYYVSNNPIEATFGLREAIKDVKGARLANKDLSQMERELYKVGLDEDIVWPQIADNKGNLIENPKRIKVDKSAVQMTTTGQGFSKEAAQQLSPDPEKFPRMAKYASLATFPARKMFEFTDKISDSFVRNAAMHVAYRRDPRVMNLMAQGLDYRAASRQAFTNPEVRARVENRVDKQLGQYYHFNKAEEQIKRLIPFYSWDRAILAHVNTTLNERPLTSGVAAELTLTATEDNREKLGKVPNSVLGAIGLGGFFSRDTDPGQKRLFLSSGINPYGTIADLTTAAKALTVGDSRGAQVLSGQINPILSTAFQGITGRSIVSNKPISSGAGFFATMAKGYLESLPQYRAVDTLVQGDRSSYVDSRGIERDFLFKRDFTDQLAGLMGATFRTMSEEGAARLYAKESGIKQPKAPKPFNWATLFDE